MVKKQQQKQSSDTWRWGQSSQNAFSLVGQFFGISPRDLATTKDSEVTKLLQTADASDVQVKRTQDAVNAVKRTWKNQTRVGAMLHGLVRTGMQHILTTRKQEATTTKEYAKAITSTSVLSAKTHTAVEKTYLKGEKQIQQAGKQLQLSKEELDEQYQVADQAAMQQSQQRRLGYRERAQKRLTANSRPWRNY
jgi:hypothetical protein